MLAGALFLVAHFHRIETAVSPSRRKLYISLFLLFIFELHETFPPSGIEGQRTEMREMATQMYIYGVQRVIVKTDTRIIDGEFESD